MLLVDLPQMNGRQPAGYFADCEESIPREGSILHWMHLNRCSHKVQCYLGGLSSSGSVQYYISLTLQDCSQLSAQERALSRSRGDEFVSTLGCNSLHS